MSTDPSESSRIARQRLHQVFKYLKALNDHRNPAIRQISEQPWSMRLDDLPDHSSIHLPFRALCAKPEENEVEGQSSHQYLLRVRRPRLTSAPLPPEQLYRWLRAGWDDPEGELQLHETQNETSEDGETVVIRFDEDPERINALAQWREKHTAWRDAEIPARQAMRTFERLYALHGRLERESERYDLAVGDGLLSWEQPDGNIYHPLLVQRVQLLFDPEVPEFSIVDTDTGSEFCTGIFHTVSDVDPRLLANQRDEFEAGGYHPLSREVSGFLSGLVNRLSPHGGFVDNKRPVPASIHPQIGRGPVLFLRSRTKGFGTAIEQVVDGIESRQEFCRALHRIVGCESIDFGSADSEMSDSQPGEQPLHDVLFGKEANREQLRIARQLDRHGAVLVQGPPGTGKSHTIANLIGHLLANGQSVLVTSHTSKALRVLREHIAKELRPLSVSVLDSDMESRKQLEQSVQAISNRLSESSADELDADAATIIRYRTKLLDDLQSRQAELLRAREDEYRDIVVAGRAYSPSEAARIVAAGVNVHDWLPSPVAIGEPLPLSVEEVHQLYATNVSTQPEDEEYALSPLPGLNELLSPEDFAESLRQSEELATASDYNASLWSGAHFTTRHIEELCSVARELKARVEDFKRFEGWRLSAVDAGRRNSGNDCPWQHLLGKVNEANRLAAQALLGITRHQPQFGNEYPLGRQLSGANQILDHLHSGGKLSRFELILHSEWRKLLDTWRVSGTRQPSTWEEVTAVKDLIQLQIARAELALLWDELLTPHGAPSAIDLGENIEEGADQFTGVIRDCREWWKVQWEPLINRVKEIGFGWDHFISKQPPDLGPFGPMRRLVTAVELHLVDLIERTARYLQSMHLRQRLRQMCDALAKYTRPEVTRLRESIEQGSVDGYLIAFNRCAIAVKNQRTAIRRLDLLGRLERHTASGTPVAETWAKAIRERRGSHAHSEPPGDVTAAWEWRQLNDELDRRSQLDLEALGRTVSELRYEINRVTNQLIDRRAWAEKVRHTSLSQQQALMGWLGIVNRIGKGFGKRVPELRREAQQQMEKCRSAVPVWIMPLARLVESFDFREPRFDVVIIDEASQCDVMGLLAMALARKVVVVGDDKQVSPLAVGQKQDIIANLIKLHLDGVPNAVLYDGRMSVYDLGKTAFSGLICLQEHFRCVPDIIQFSNQFYNGAIKPLRESSSSPLRPHVVPYRVEGTRMTDSKVNPEEALAIASLVVAASEHPAYQGQSFGIISLLGDEQAFEIEKQLLIHLAPDVYEKRRIICGTPAQFQGDERDVVFLSMVDSGKPRLSDRMEMQQRYNVAASRARNQMWVVHSLNPQDLAAADLRRRLIEHALDPNSAISELERASLRAESAFEKEVLKRLVYRGYRVRPQWSVGRYRIDIVVEGGGKRLAVECDGDRYHPIEKLPEDMERQSILERLGWRFVRLRGSAFYRNPDQAMESVFQTLEELNIPPEGNGESATITPVNDNVVVDLTRRAAEIRAGQPQATLADDESNTFDPGMSDQPTTVSNAEEQNDGDAHNVVDGHQISNGRQTEKAIGSPDLLATESDVMVIDGAGPQRNVSCTVCNEADVPTAAGSKSSSTVTAVTQKKLPFSAIPVDQPVSSTERLCPKCGHPLKIKQIRVSDKLRKFWGCSQFPRCRFTDDAK